MNRLSNILNHKLTQFFLVLVAAYLVFQFGIPALSLLLTGRAAPVPSQVLWSIYMPTVLLAMLLYVSANEASWNEFRSPLYAFVVEDRQRPVVIGRTALMVALPLLAGWLAYNRVQPRVTPPAELRAIHPAPSGSITVDGETVNLRTAANPLRDGGGTPAAADLEAGKIVYGQYCVYCHGDALDGSGLFAHAMRPRPADFTDPGTIASLQESFLFWRIATGGPGMPHEGKGWNSAMPAWEGTLTQEQMWQVIAYMYDATGQHPLSVDEHAARTGDRALGRSGVQGGVGVMAAAAGQIGRGRAAAAGLAQEDVGRVVYTKYCEVCHGAEGDANTPPAANMDPKPRDLRRGWYKIRTTASGQLPTDTDIVRLIRTGMPGTTMPGWEGVLTEAEIQAVAAYIKTFSRRFGREQPAALEMGPKVETSEESKARGKEIYLGAEAECSKCHGSAGRGDGPSADELTEDSFGDVIVPADLTMPWLFRGGPTVDDIYWRLKTGMTGGPMPSYADVLADEDIWHLANYVDSLGPDAAPEQQTVLIGALSQGALPDDPNAEAWQAAQEVYFPLFGQIMQEPRNFTPMINGVWVSALYNEDEIALRLRWHDRLNDTGGSGGGEGEEVPDGLAVQFPAELPDNDERPYFVFGDPAHPVNLWVWSAQTSQAEERTARGTGTDAAQAQNQLNSAAAYADGEYTLILRRSLRTGAAEDVVIQPGQFIPIAFAAWDGWSGEQLTAGSISTWYLLYLDRPAPVTALGWIPAAALVTALVETGAVWAVRRNRKSKRTIVGE